MIKSLFVSVNILVGALGFASPLSTTDSIESTEVSRNQRYEVTKKVEGDGVYLEGEDGDTAYLVEDEFSSKLTVGEMVTVVFDKDGDVVEVLEDESKYYQYKVVHIGADGVYLEGEDSDEVYLEKDEFSSSLSEGDIITIAFDTEGDIEDIIEDVKKVSIY